MRPLTLPERGVEIPKVSMADMLAGRAEVRGRTAVSLRDYVSEMTAGGFPGMRHLEGRALERQLDSYLNLIVDHDLPEAGFVVRRPATLRAWLSAYAAATGTSATWETIRDAASAGVAEKPAKTTTLPYIELLTALRILDPVEAWTTSRNHLQSLTYGPKHFLADPALAARLVRRNATQLLAGAHSDSLVPRDGGFLGGLFEGLACLSIRTFAQHADARVFHLRTKGGRHEVDFIVDGPNGVVGVEVKLAGAVDDHDVRHLVWLRDRIGDDCVDLMVVHTGPDAYRRPDGVAVVPLALLGP
jgi:predicted AAA+ superfamily ATPase